MSHNIMISNVKIADLDALRMAVAELKGEGREIEIHENGTFRTWQGQPNKCDVTIHLPKERFDVGLVKQPDGSYAPVFDHMLDSNRTIACDLDRGEGRNGRTAIGKLMERYSTCVVELQAAREGHMTRRTTNEAGETVVEITV